MRRLWRGSVTQTFRFDICDCVGDCDESPPQQNHKSRPFDLDSVYQDMGLPPHIIETYPTVQAKKNHDDFCRLFLSSHDILYTPSHNNCNNNRQQQQQLNGFQRFRGAGKEKKRKANIKECRGYPI